jgi:acyl dehydratase
MVRFEELQVGLELPPLTKAPITTRQLVQYAGASGDFNPIHYDADFARAGGYPSVIAHGMLSMAFLGQLVSRWAGPAAICRISTRFKAVTFPGDVISVSGQVTALDPAARTAELALIARNQAGAVTLEGAATLKL